MDFMSNHALIDNFLKSNNILVRIFYTNYIFGGNLKLNVFILFDF